MGSRLSGKTSSQVLDLGNERSFLELGCLLIIGQTRRSAPTENAYYPCLPIPDFSLPEGLRFHFSFFIFRFLFLIVLGRFISACPLSPTWDLNLKFKILLLIFPGICTINKSEFKQNGRRKKFLEFSRSRVMTGLLKEAFEKASMLPEEFQDEIARD